MFIGFHLGHCLCPFKAIALEPLDKVVEDQGVGTFGTIFRKNPDKQ
jgi:hypothetical protein